VFADHQHPHTSLPLPPGPPRVHLAVLSVHYQPFEAHGCGAKVRREGGMSAYVSIRQHTSAYVGIRRHTSAYVSMRQHASAYVSVLTLEADGYGTACESQCNKAYLRTTSANVSKRQQTSAYVRTTPAARRSKCCSITGSFHGCE
jgi:hypothetical protein